MRNWKLPVLIGVGLFGLIGLYVAFYFVFLDFFVDLWWFRSLEFEAYFWLRMLYRFIFSGVVTVFFLAIFNFHFWIASRYLGSTPTDEVLLNDVKRRRFQQVTDAFASGSAKVYIPISLILAIAIAMPFYQQWEDALLFFFGSDSEVVDPIYGQDISFYLFSYPIYIIIQKELLVTAILVLLFTGILYWLEHEFIPDESKEFPLGAKIHLSALSGFVVLFVVWGFLLQRYALLYTHNNEPVFYGPGFIELRYNLPLIWIEIGLFLIFVGTLLFNIFSAQHRSKRMVLVTLFGFVLAVAAQKNHLIPELLEKFIVKPNFTRTQSDSISHNIDATLDAYDLNNIKIVDFPVSLDPNADIEAWSNQKHFENIPVWDRELLDDSYMQLQGIRTYYNFPTIDEDRYFIHGHYQQVNLAAREVNIDRLPKEAQNWENKHLRYTHGFGAVVSPAAQDAGIPIVWYLRDLNMSSPVGLSVRYPDIYYGQEKQYPYAIVPNKLPIADISGSDPREHMDYQGASGIPINSLFKKILFAFYFNDEKIFFSPNIDQNSKLLIRRNVTDRISHLTPYLHLDKDPYLVVDKDRFYWIQDAYTLSNTYPVSKPAADDYLDGKQEFNYIRNSVKIVVDAYDGHVDYYISDPKDPLVNAFSRAYPGVFKPLQDMPNELRLHLRYPRDLYFMQMKIFAKYHQTEPSLFYEQAETWQLPNVDGQPVLPYFLTMDFGHCNNREEMVMVGPMTPIRRDNLSMLGIASTLDQQGCADNSYKPSILVYRFPIDMQVNGPSQVNALIDQNPEISAQFSLWNQQGSEIRKGRMVIVPIGRSILYVQPIYMLSSKTKMPELARVIVSIGSQVAMDTTLQGAFSSLKSLFIKNVSNTRGSGVSGVSAPSAP